MLTALYTVAVVLVTGTAASLLSHDPWWIRFFDFPRKQIASGVLLTIVGLIYLAPQTTVRTWTIFALLACFVYQFDHIIQYTVLAPEEVKEARPGGPTTETIRLLTANVEVGNRHSTSLLELIEEEDPEVVLALETDRWWVEELEKLEDRYEHTLLHPREDAYGMCLYSKYPLRSAEVRHLIDDDTPSIKARLRLDCGVDVQYYGMHPRPPHPLHEPDTTERDAELITLAREIEHPERPTIVTGDLNDVSWSHTTDAFQNISGLLDPRRGRGFYNTFHARYPVIRYPLDHTFHSVHFRVQRLEILRYIGSDHYPVLAELQYDPEVADEHSPPRKCHITEAWAEREMGKLERKRSQ